LLIVEDDTALRRSLHTTLGLLGFDVSEASNGEDAHLRRADYEAVLLDINMPGIGGIETCRRIRRISTKLQILMLTVRDDEDDKVEALEAGADDYVTKPFQSRELAARLRTAIRRFRAPEVPADITIVIGSVLLNPVHRRVERNGVEVHLTAREFNALQLLMTQAGRPLSHARLLGTLRGPDFVSDRAYLRVLIGQLRKKLEDDPSNPTHLLTDSYIGYRFREP
jgi:two-component system KDP operon response regulator KdpE